MNGWKSALAPLLIGLELCGFAAPSPRPAFAADSTAVWRPAANDEFAVDCRFVETLLFQGFNKDASAELARLEPRFDAASEDARLLFGAAAIRVAVETSRLSNTADLADVAQKIAAVRERIAPILERVGENDSIRAAESEYLSALVRAYFELGVLDARNAENAETQAPDSPYLADAFALAKRLVGRPSPEDARPFVYWSAKILLAQVEFSQDVKSEASAEKIRLAERASAALEKASAEKRDAFYFLAKLLRIESARIQGVGAAASAQIAETFAELDGASPDVAAALNVALVAEQTRVLANEGKTNDALRLALADVDLGARPLAPRFRTRFDALFDPFDARNFANAELFWAAAAASESAPALPDAVAEPNGADGPNRLGASQPLEKKRLVDAAKNAVANVSANFWKTRAARLVRDAARESDDWRTTEAAAEENYRRSLWEAALADFDRASSEASAAGADADAFRLAGAAAAIVDKINRDKIFATDNLSSADPEFWRSEAVRRFDALSRSRPDDPIAPRLFLLALDYSDASSSATPESQTARRLDYLRLFPAAQNRETFACDAARRALDVGRFDDAAAFLDFVATSSPDFPTALDAEKRLARARLDAARSDGADRAALFADVVRRLLTKTTAGRGVGATDSLEAALAQTAQNLTSDALSDVDSSIFEAIFELATSGATEESAAFNAEFETFLNRWEETISEPTVSETTKISAFRLSFWLDAKKTDEILRWVADAERATHEAATETLERLAKFAENAPPETQKEFGEFLSTALDSPNLSDAATTSGPPPQENDRRAALRAQALRLSGKTQESLNLFAALRKKNPKNVAAVRGIAVALTERAEPDALEQALRFWSDVADLVPVDSPDWWDAKERCVEIYSRLGRKDQAAKMTKTIWLTRSDPSDPGRRARWERLCR